MATKDSGNAEENTSQVSMPVTADDMIVSAESHSDEIPTMKELEGVRYTGMADIKTLSANDLRAVGVEPKGEDDLVWFDDNGKFVKGDQINAATRDWLASQPDFVVV